MRTPIVATATMPSVNLSLHRRDAYSAVHQLVKRENWPQREVGVMVVLCIVGVLLIGLVVYLVQRALNARKARRQTV